MYKAPLDDSLAFTIVLHERPGIGARKAADVRAALLEAWYEQTAVKNLWEFGRAWLNEHHPVTTG